MAVLNVGLGAAKMALSGSRDGVRGYDSELTTPANRGQNSYSARMAVKELETLTPDRVRSLSNMLADHHSTLVLRVE